MDTSTVSRVVRASALYDLLVTAGFATPWTAPASVAVLTRVHHALGLGGAVPNLDDPFAMLFANLLGSIVVVWSVVRLLRPSALHGAADSAGRVLFAAWFCWALGQGGSQVLIGFAVLEIAWGLLQAAVVLRVEGTAVRGRRLAPC
ncbi:MAG TPA: hypothetical protein VHZ06_02995 [Marmoricola sp.]|nr:hypothetical protein [Marmoricola sp.]